MATVCRFLARKSADAAGSGSETHRPRSLYHISVNQEMAPRFQSIFSLLAFDIGGVWWQNVIVPSQTEPAVDAACTVAIEETMKGRTNHVSCQPS
ncbi:MAG: hypothetical protein NTV73_01605 [Hyphomicrobiales bacterium]|nr:hypothetical protein [Hyphomicrobiales bacterium]